MCEDRRASLRLPAVLDSVIHFQSVAREVGAACGLTEEEYFRLDLVLEEILVNIVRHAYPAGGGWMEMACTCPAVGSLVIEIRDGGRPFNPFARPDPRTEVGLSERQIGGLGIMLVKKMADTATYRRQGEVNVLTFTFVKRPVQAATDN